MKFILRIYSVRNSFRTQKILKVVEFYKYRVLSILKYLEKKKTKILHLISLTEYSKQKLCTKNGFSGIGKIEPGRLFRVIPYHSYGMGLKISRKRICFHRNNEMRNLKQRVTRKIRNELSF